MRTRPRRDRPPSAPETRTAVDEHEALRCPPVPAHAGGDAGALPRSHLRAPDIVEARLALIGRGAGDVQMRLMSTCPTREFVVQHEETELAFIPRLTEHLGISIFLEPHEVPEGFAGGVVEYCQHPKTFEASQSLATIRAEERFAEPRYLEGKGDVYAFSAGGAFHLGNHPRFEGGRDVLVVSDHHPITQVWSGSAVTSRNPSMHRIVTASGIMIEMKGHFDRELRALSTIPPSAPGSDRRARAASPAPRASRGA